MGDVTVSIDLGVPAAELWRFVEPIERHVDWMADAESIRFETNQTRGVGTAFLCATKFGPIRLTDRMDITEWAPIMPTDPSATVGRMGVRHRGIVTGSGVFTIEPIDDQHSRFTWSEALTFPWYLGGRFGAAVGARLVLGPVWRRNLRTLESLIAR